MTTLDRPNWRRYRHCYECGVDKAVACRDDMDRIADVPCQGRRLRAEAAEFIPDDVVPAAPVKASKPTLRTTRPEPVVIGGHVVAFDDVALKPSAPVRCYDDELFPFKPIAKPIAKKCCAYCRANIIDDNGHMRTCRKVECTRRREAARREVAA
jgi:hypothetical protein